VFNACQVRWQRATLHMKNKACLRARLSIFVRGWNDE
jgi:hypothetical protein